MIRRLWLCFENFLVGFCIVVGAVVCYLAYCVHQPSNYESSKNIFLIIDHPRQTKSNAKLFIQKGLASRVHNHPIVIELTLKIARLCGYPLKFGEYKLPEHISLWSAIKILSRSKQVIHKITIPEGFSMYRTIQRIKDNKFLVGEIESVPEEGYCLPDTYCFRYPTTRQQILDQAKAAMEKFLKEVWKTKSEDCFLKTPREILTLASIIEKESHLDLETIAGMYLNRIKRNMKLQSDPTVVYALVQGQRFPRSVTYKDLKCDNPYNTYRHYGLPPGPIANPGRKAILAALHPKKSEFLYLFFEKDGMDKPLFGKTFKEHKQHIAWFKSLRNKNK